MYHEFSYKRPASHVNWYSLLQEATVHISLHLFYSSSIPLTDSSVSGRLFDSTGGIKNYQKWKLLTKSTFICFAVVKLTGLPTRADMSTLSRLADFSNFLGIFSPYWWNLHLAESSKIAHFVPSLELGTLKTQCLGLIHISLLKLASLRVNWDYWSNGLFY